MPDLPRVLLFDLDGTLLEDGAVRGAAERTVDDLVTEVPGLDPARLLRANEQAFERYFPKIRDTWALGGISGAEVALEVWRRTLEPFGVEDKALIARTQQRFAAQARARHHLYDDARLFLKAVRGRFPIAAITNGASDAQREKLQCTDIEAQFDDVFISAELGVPKPDPGIFSVALERLRVTSEQAWHVGDSLRTDIGGAKASGIKAVWINRDGRVVDHDDERVPDIEIASLAELHPVLGLDRPHRGPG